MKAISITKIYYTLLIVAILASKGAYATDFHIQNLNGFASLKAMSKAEYDALQSKMPKDGSSILVDNLYKKDPVTNKTLVNILITQEKIPINSDKLATDEDFIKEIGSTLERLAVEYQLLGKWNGFERLKSTQAGAEFFAKTFAGKQIAVTVNYANYDENVKAEVETIVLSIKPKAKRK